MKKLLKMIGVTGFLCLLCALPGAAQITNPVSFTTNFPFYAGTMKMPAGTYTVAPSGMDSSFLEIKDKSGSHTGFLDYSTTQTRANTEHGKTSVTFNRYGTTEFLNQIWAAGQVNGVQLDQSKMEQKMSSAGKAEQHSVEGKP
jgi:hypothetical protein